MSGSAWRSSATAEEERPAVAAHLEGCDTCRADVRAFSETAWTLAETAEREPPARLRAAIVDRGTRDGGVSAPRPTWRERIVDAVRRPVPAAIPIGLAIALVVALVGYGGARRDADRYATAVAGVAGARVVPMAPTGELGNVRGSLVLPVNGATPYLILELPAPPSGKTWEAWVLHGEQALAAGITDEHGITTLVLTAPLGAGDAVAVTLEPSGGVQKVTGNPVLVGKT